LTGGRQPKQTALKRVMALLGMAFQSVDTLC
jgi:hypothetical protein